MTQMSLCKIDKSILQVENALNLNLQVLEYLEFRFRGLEKAISELLSYLNGWSRGKKGWKEFDLEDGIKEIRIRAGNRTPQLISQFPALKATGIILDYSKGTIYAVYSDSGYRVLNKAELCFGASFDPKSDESWIWKHDIMEHAEGYYIDLRCNEKTHYLYDYPSEFKDKWDDQKYLIEIDGEFYEERSAIENEFDIQDGILKQYCGYGGEIVIPEGVIRVAHGTFSNNSRITAITFPGSLEKIDNFICDNCDALQKVVISEGCRSIGEYAFAQCKKLVELVLPDSISTIGECAFLETNLDFETIHLPANIKDVYNAFDTCIHVPNALYNTDKTCLLRLSSEGSETEYTIPDTVKRIACGAFDQCRKLEKVNIPDSVKEIGEQAFRWCDTLREITLPPELQVIKKDTFLQCRSLKKTIVSEGVCEIETGAFASCHALKTVCLPNSINTLGSNLSYHYHGGFSSRGVFEDCISLEELVLPRHITAISDRLCWGCIKLKKVIIPENVKRIGNRAFMRNTKLKNIVLPNSLEWIGDEAFKECSALESVYLPGNVKFEGSYQFQCCKKLQDVVIPGSVEEIPIGMFEKCSSLCRIVVREGVTKIGGRAFANCKGLSQVYIYASPKKYGAKVFYKSSNVHVYGIPCSKVEDCAKDNEVPFYDIASQPLVDA